MPQDRRKDPFGLEYEHSEGFRPHTILGGLTLSGEAAGGDDVPRSPVSLWTGTVRMRLRSSFVSRKKERAMRKCRKGSAAWLDCDRRSSLGGAKRHGWRSSTGTLAVRNMPSFESLEPRRVLSGDPTISEFLASNSGGLLDEDGDSSDWIEVANPNPEPVDLGGWFLTDDADNLQSWKFPETTIEPYGRVFVFASGKNRTEPDDPLHTSFKLGADGEFLALVKPDGTSIASQFAPEFPQQRTDVSYGMTVIEEVTELVSAESPATFIVPTSDLNAEIGQSWRNKRRFQRFDRGRLETNNGLRGVQPQPR